MLWALLAPGHPQTWMGQRAFAFSALALVTRCKLPLKSRESIIRWTNPSTKKNRLG